MPKSSFSTIWFALKWLVRLAMLGAAAYYLQPLYAPPKPTVPSSIGAGDFVTWKFSSDPDPLVTQTLTIFGSGSNVVMLVRHFGDPDIPMDGGWAIKGDKQTQIIEFKKWSLVPPARALSFLKDTLQAGLLNAHSISAPAAEKVDIQSSFGGNVRSVTGPQHLSSAADMNPDSWNNRLRWQKLGQLIQADATVKNLLAKKEVKLVDDDKMQK